MNHNNQKKIKITELLIYVSLVSLSSFSTDLYAPALPSMVKFFSTTSSTLQQSLISYMYGFSLCMLISGIISDYLGRKNILLLGLTIYFLSSLSILFISTPWQLIWIRFFQGLGGCVGTVIARIMVREQFSADTTIAIFSYLVAGMSLTFALSPLLGTLLISYFNWTCCFGIMAGIGFCLLISVHYFLSDVHIRTSFRKISFKQILNDYYMALNDQEFRYYTLVISLSWAGFFIIIVEYPFIITQQCGYTNFGLGVILFFIMMGYLSGSFIIRKTKLKNLSILEKNKLGLTIMIAAATLGSLSSLSFNFLSLTLPAFLYLIGMAIIIPNSQYAALSNPKIATATVTSLLYFIEMLATACLSGFVRYLFFPNLKIVWPVISFLILILLLALPIYIQSNKKSQYICN